MFVQQTWDVHRSWLHWSEFLREEELKYSKRYHYRVCWSVPTRRKPIPRATASIYFVIEISKIKPAVSSEKWHALILQGTKVQGGFLRQGDSRAAERPARRRQLSREMLRRPGYCHSTVGRFKHSVMEPSSQSPRGAEYRVGGWFRSHVVETGRNMTNRESGRIPHLLSCSCHLPLPSNSNRSGQL